VVTVGCCVVLISTVRWLVSLWRLIVLILSKSYSADFGPEVRVPKKRLLNDHSLYGIHFNGSFNRSAVGC